MTLIAPAFLLWLFTMPISSSGVVPAGRAPSTTLTQEENEADTRDARVNPSQPDFTLVALPTTLRVPRHKSAFRVTHRFTRALGQGDFGDLASDLFGLDSGAQIGLELRYGLVRGGQIGIHRTNDKTIQLFGQYDVLRQTENRPIGLAAFVSVDGTDNFKDRYSPAIAAVVSREFGRHGAVYVEPVWVGNTDLREEAEGDDSTFLLGLGARLRVRPTVYVVVEFIPRLSGFDPGVNQAGFAIEKRAGGHAFQLSVSNAFGTTMGQIARGGPAQLDGDSNWYLGFNISRKFF
jgi:hypothetical protein